MFETAFLFLVGAALLPVYWFAACCVFVILWSLVVHEKIGWSLFFTIPLVVMLIAAFPSAVTFLSNPLYAGLVVVAYVAIGVVWATCKWALLVSKAYNTAIEVRDHVLASLGITDKDYFRPAAMSDLDPNFRANAVTYSNAIHEKFCPRGHNYYERGDDGVCPTESILYSIRRKATPQVSENKSKIMVWLMWWPLSVTWFVIADLVTDFYTWLREVVGTQFQRHADAKFDNL